MALSAVEKEGILRQLAAELYPVERVEQGEVAGTDVFTGIDASNLRDGGVPGLKGTVWGLVFGGSMASNREPLHTRGLGALYRGRGLLETESISYWRLG